MPFCNDLFVYLPYKLQDISTRRSVTKERRIIGVSSHLSHGLFSPLLSDRRYHSIRSRPSRLQDSFFSQAIRRLNSNHHPPPPPALSAVSTISALYHHHLYSYTDGSPDIGLGLGLSSFWSSSVSHCATFSLHTLFSFCSSHHCYWVHNNFTVYRRTTHSLYTWRSTWNWRLANWQNIALCCHNNRHLFLANISYASLLAKHTGCVA